MRDMKWDFEVLDALPVTHDVRIAGVRDGLCGEDAAAVAQAEGVEGEVEVRVCSHQPGALERGAQGTESDGPGLGVDVQGHRGFVFGEEELEAGAGAGEVDGSRAGEGEGPDAVLEFGGEAGEGMECF